MSAPDIIHHGMTPAREAALLAQVPTLGCHAEAVGFRAALSAAGEGMTVDLMRVLRDRIDLLARREGVI